MCVTFSLLTSADTVADVFDIIRLLAFLLAPRFSSSDEYLLDVVGLDEVCDDIPGIEIAKLF